MNDFKLNTMPKYFNFPFLSSHIPQWYGNFFLNENLTLVLVRTIRKKQTAQTNFIRYMLKDYITIQHKL